jgi:predicted glycosyltransferase
MRIWFDISNSPHIAMFYDLIRELEDDGHDIIITSRPLANTVDLLNQRGLKHTIVGEHYGKSFIRKLFGFPIRVLQLARFLRRQRPHLAVSQSSFHSPLVAKILGIPSIYTNDNEHALGNKIAFMFATKILVPENLDKQKVRGWGISMKKIVQYPGVKEGIYLWRRYRLVQVNHRKAAEGTMQVFIRPEPRTAQYYKGRLNFLDETIMGLKDKFSVTILVRDSHQREYYKQKKFSSVVVPEKPMPFESIATHCDLFIGAGGSMTRELAVLGVPAISVYQDKLLAVDEYLVEQGLLHHEPNITSIKVESFLNSGLHSDLKVEIIHKGRIAYELLKSEILAFMPH